MARSKKDKLFVLPEPVLQKVLDYLGRRPWAEVDNIIVTLRANLVPLQPDWNSDEVHEELKRIRAGRGSSTS